jgi:hypothetical protein
VKLVLCGKQKLDFTTDDGKKVNGLRVFVGQPKNDFIEGVSDITPFFVPNNSPVFGFLSNAKTLLFYDFEFEPNLLTGKIYIKSVRP